MSNQRTTRLRLALFGHPLGHSRSPQLFAAQQQAGGVTVDYQPIDVTAEDLPQVMQRLRAGEWDGANVTIPHKETLLAHCDRLDSSAVAAGAVNVLRRTTDGTICGFNTDGLGFLSGLRRYYPNIDPEQRGGALRVALLGAGGAARGVAAVLRPHGVDLVVVSRDRERAAARFGLALAPSVLAWDDPALTDRVADCELIIQATSLGMSPREELEPPLADQAFGERQTVVDLIYNPWRTLFLRRAEAGGAATLNGWPMLVGQAAAALDLWAGAGRGELLIDAASQVERRDPTAG